jgi:hypothetical protein
VIVKQKIKKRSVHHYLCVCMYMAHALGQYGKISNLEVPTYS